MFMTLHSKQYGKIVGFVITLLGLASGIVVPEITAVIPVTAALINTVKDTSTNSFLNGVVEGASLSLLKGTNKN